MVADNSGNLYAGGDFTVIANVRANRIAKWDGNAWSPLDAGLNGRVNAIAVFFLRRKSRWPLIGFAITMAALHGLLLWRFVNFRWAG